MALLLSGCVVGRDACNPRRRRGLRCGAARNANQKRCSHSCQPHPINFTLCTHDIILLFS
eukprot:570951-Amorphochlora_amoeboformis.AAC.1